MTMSKEDSFELGKLCMRAILDSLNPEVHKKLEEQLQAMINKYSQ